ncbi:MAG TPA: Crp/Fnr family transcriptional regulator [Chloroflexi bacterium]|nr:Crp/Fnr family transcriptional regulator [Chloroflexota bacterium]
MPPFSADDRDILAETSLFQDLPPEELAQLRASARPVHRPRGGYFFMQGDPLERMYLLVTGRIKITQLGPDGQQILLRALGPGSLFGVVVLTQAKECPVTAEALEDSTALSWTRADLMDCAQRCPTFALNALQVMAAHAQEFQERFRQLATERVERRLAHTLLRLASQAGRKLPEGVLIDLPLTRQELGEMAGTTQYTVSRLLTQWESQGLIYAGRERIIIRHPHGLVSLAEG